MESSEFFDFRGYQVRIFATNTEINMVLVDESSQTQFEGCVDNNDQRPLHLLLNDIQDEFRSDRVQIRFVHKDCIQLFVFAEKIKFLLNKQTTTSTALLIHSLERKISQLEDKNKELEERLQTSINYNQRSMKSMSEIFKVMFDKIEKDFSEVLVRIHDLETSK